MGQGLHLGDFFMVVFLAIIMGLSLGGCSRGPLSSTQQISNQIEAVPKLFLQPATIFDAVCQQKTGFKVEPEWQQELFARLSDFQGEWEKKAVSLIVASEELAERKFSRKEYSVALTLCKWTPMGDPAFIVSVRPYLKGPAAADEKIKQPMSMAAFVSMTHHELLHSLVDNLISTEFYGASAALEKYKKEPFNVQVHLHLLALQKSAYEKLGDTELLKNTERLYDFIGGDYARAWEIVGLEGAEKLVGEVKTYNQKRN